MGEVQRDLVGRRDVVQSDGHSAGPGLNRKSVPKPVGPFSLDSLSLSRSLSLVPRAGSISISAPGGMVHQRLAEEQPAKRHSSAPEKSRALWETAVCGASSGAAIARSFGAPEAPN